MKQHYLIVLMSIITVFTFSSCSFKYNTPRVQIDSVSYITHSTAVIFCQVTDDGGSTANYSGAVWDTLPNSFSWENRWDHGSEFSKYTVALTSLKPNTIYYVKAFASNSEGISHSDVITFKTLPAEMYTDTRDGSVYAEVIIGSQVWMGENLRYHIPGISKPVYNDYYGDLTHFGQLYTYEALENICPDGWRLPSDDDWKTLEKYLGMDESEIADRGLRGSREDRQLKVPGRQYWRGSDIEVTNSSGFSAFPAGTGEPEYVGAGAYFWTMPEAGNDTVWYRYLINHEGGIGRMGVNSFSDADCYSVRCLKN